jgi:hypothetical protein
MTEEIVEVETTVISANEITELADASGLEKSTAMMLKEEFSPLFDAADKWAKNARSIVVTDITQTREMKMAREYRMALRDIRLKAEKRKDALKADALAYGKAVQGMYNVILGLVEPLERYLSEQEKFAEVQAAKEKAEKLAQRKERMKPYFGYWDEDVDLSAFSDERFEKYVADAKECMEEADRIAEEERLRLAKAEEDARKAREEAEALRIQMEAERIAAEKAKAEQERKAREEAEEKEAAHRKELERIAEEQRIADAKRKATEEAERIERERAEAEAKAKRDAELAEERRVAEEKLKAERAETERIRKEKEELELERMRAEAAERERVLAEKAAARKAEKAPDDEKFKAWAKTLYDTAVSAKPSFSGPDAEEMNIKRDKIIAAIKQYCGDVA